MAGYNQAPCRRDDNRWWLPEGHPVERRRFQRLYEMWLVLTNQCSLHAAWQHGADYGRQQEYQRVVVNGGDYEAFAYYRSQDERARLAAGRSVLGEGSGVLEQGNVRPRPGDDQCGNE